MPKRKDPTAKKRQKGLVARNKARGLIQPRFWIPAYRRDELEALCAQWRAEHKLKGDQ